MCRPTRLPAEALGAALAKGGTVVDTRQARDFGLGAVPGTINIPLSRAFTTWAGSLLPYDRDFYLIVDDLAGIGLDRSPDTSVPGRWKPGKARPGTFKPWMP